MRSRGLQPLGSYRRVPFEIRAAQSFVSYSFEDEFSTINTNINGTHYMLSAVKDRAPKCRFYFAGSSEMFGHAEEVPQKETTRFHPRSPYGISKVAGFDLTRNYREAYGLFALSVILFNHESPRRGYEFVTRAQRELGWKPKTLFPQLVRDMVESDIRLLSNAAAR